MVQDNCLQSEHGIGRFFHPSRTRSLHAQPKLLAPAFHNTAPNLKTVISVSVVVHSFKVIADVKAAVFHFLELVFERVQFLDHVGCVACEDVCLGFFKQVFSMVLLQVDCVHRLGPYISPEGLKWASFCGIDEFIQQYTPPR